MFGCGTPVLAKNYPAIDELVLPATNGDLFETADQLSQQIQNWFEVNTFLLLSKIQLFLNMQFYVLDIILYLNYARYNYY